MGAFQAKTYRNVFKEFGYSDEQIQEKLNNAWEDLFYGDSETRIYYTVSEDEAYIYDVGSEDVRSEGMSYGMMMCVQMNKQKEFDCLWKWAKTHMQNKSGINEGYFAWSMNTNGTPKDTGPASDGEEYFAMALFFASNRWGDRQEPFDYSAQARYILHRALHQEKYGEGKSMWFIDEKLIKFVPSWDNVSDPSYHLPHFYELFALWANEEDREFWHDAARASREYIKLTCHPVTGLAPEYSTLDGLPFSANSRHDLFSSDSYRVGGNIGLDYEWFSADEAFKDIANRIQAFFVKEGLGKHYSIYTIDGIPQAHGDYVSTGLVAMNAMASLAADGSNVKKMIDDFWNKSTSKGRWRYYDDCLYFFSLLALSGNYKIWE